jgi:hypothetical protein
MPSFPHNTADDQRAGNLLAEHDGWVAGPDEPHELGPEVALVTGASLASGCAERLARARAAPNGFILRPSGKLKGERPAGDSAEEVALAVSIEVFRLNVRNASGVDVSIGNQAGCNQFSDPSRRHRIDLVIVVHVSTLLISSNLWCSLLNMSGTTMP